MRPAITASFRDTSIIVVGVIAIKNGYSDKVFLYTELCRLLMLLESIHVCSWATNTNPSLTKKSRINARVHLYIIDVLQYSS